MGAILRRQIRLVQAGMQALNVEERQWLRTQGVDRPEELPRRSLWYHPDGSSALGWCLPQGFFRFLSFTLRPCRGIGGADVRVNPIVTRLRFN
mgnify:CR=1 FL=1